MIWAVSWAKVMLGTFALVATTAKMAETLKMQRVSNGMSCRFLSKIWTLSDWETPGRNRAVTAGEWVFTEHRRRRYTWGTL